MKTIITAAIVFAAFATQGAAQATEASRIKRGLTHDQTHALQQALKDDGCYRGRVDGVIGPATRRAIACSRKKHDISGNNSNELFRVLNLDFTVADSTGMGGVMSSGRRSGYRPPEKTRDRGTVNTSKAASPATPVKPDAPDEHRVKGMPADTHGLRKGAPPKPVKPNN